MAREAERRKEATALILVGAIFGAALALRLYGGGFGLPYAEEADEPAIMDLAVRMLVQGDWNPHWYSYPTFPIYIQSAVAWLYFQAAHARGELAELSQLGGVDYNWLYIPQPELYRWGRAVSAVLGAATTAALYAAGARLYSRTVGLLAAVTLALTFLHVEYSHFIRTDVPLALFITVTLWAAARVYQSGRGIDYALAGVGIGLTMASKYNGLLVVAPVVVAHLLRAQGGGGWRIWLDPRRHAPLATAAGIAVGIFWVTNPFALLDLESWVNWLRFDADYYKYIGPQVESIGYYLGYFQERGGFGALLTPAALLGLGWTLARRRPADLITASFPLVYFPFLISWQNRNIRSAIPLTPFLALLAALAVVEGVGWVTRARPGWNRLRALRVPLLVVVMAALLAGPAAKALAEDESMARPTTRALATGWVAANVPRGARVLSEPEAVRVSTPQEPVKPERLGAQTAAELTAAGIDFLVTADDPAGPRALDPALGLVHSIGGGELVGPLVRVYRVPEHPLELELVEASLDRTRYAPGETARLTLHWRVGESLDENYVESVRLMGSEPGPVYEFSERPQGGNGKTKRWTPGQVVTDAHTFQWAPDIPAGRYRVEVGFTREGSEYALALARREGGSTRALAVGTVKITLPPPAGATPARGALERSGAVFADAIELRGFQVTPRVVEGGATVKVLLIWGARREMDKSYTRFAHLVDGQGGLIAQQDGVPGPDFPTQVWEVDEGITEALQLAVPNQTAGTARVEVGWYEFPSLQRLTTTEGADKAVLGEIEVR